MDGMVLRRVASVRRLRLEGARRQLAELTRRTRELADALESTETERLNVLIDGQQSIRNERDALFQDSFRVSELHGLRATAEALAARVGRLAQSIAVLEEQHAAAEVERSVAARSLLSMQRKCEVLESTGRALVASQTSRASERAIENDWSLRQDAKRG